MENTRMVFCTDVHLCDIVYFGVSTEDRMERLISQLNSLYDEWPYEKIVFLGDYSLDHWQWKTKGSWLEHGISNTDRFRREYASRLKTPYYMMPGNHEQYGEEAWKKITGTSRQSYFTVGGYLIICCDNFAGLLDPDFHSDGVYSPTDLQFVRKAMAEYPDMPVILCSHWYELGQEPDEFFDFIKTEKRITFLICGHDHFVDVADLGERAGNVCVYHAGNYSCYIGNKRPTEEVLWGFCEAVLTDDGVDIMYVEPENDMIIHGKPFHLDYREQFRRFFPRRDR